MASGLDQRKLKALESYRLNALVTLISQLFPKHPLNYHLKEKIEKSTNATGDGLIEENLLTQLKTDLLSNIPKTSKNKIEKLWNHFQSEHSFKLHHLITQIHHLQQDKEPNYQQLIAKYHLTPNLGLGEHQLFQSNDEQPKIRHNNKQQKSG